MSSVALGLGLLAVGVVLAARPSTAIARLRALDQDEAGPRVRRRRITRLRGGVGTPAATGGLLFGGLSSLGFGQSVPMLPALAGTLAGGAAGSLLAGAAVARERRRRDAALVEAVGALAADLRAGRQPTELIAADRQAEHLRAPAVAAVWTVSERSGAPAAAVLDRVEQDLRMAEQHRREVSAQLAGARSTAALLAVLPLLGIGLGAAMGARPLHVLFGTGRGQVALLVGAGLDALGLLWTARIVAAAGGER